ncbi:lipoyl(octanoyl) transferase LipB [Bacteroidales bacterium]|nr:lipoyl(octanoyl) transferase LipB [Bacteroidales bacterium]
MNFISLHFTKHKNIMGYYIDLEQCIIDTIAEYGLKGDRLEGATGVWLDTGTPHVRKICAIGVKASRFVTMHGFALNVNTDLKYFSYINPCGFIDKGVTSMEKELNAPIEIEKIKLVLKNNIMNTFDNCEKLL